jgi:hypothetical protein
MEAHGFDASDIYHDPDLAVYHGQDFLKYRVHQMNVGPFGFSPHTEIFAPIVVPYQLKKPEPKPKRERYQRTQKLFRTHHKI